jgi:hypothetical protein
MYLPDEVPIAKKYVEDMIRGFSNVTWATARARNIHPIHRRDRPSIAQAVTPARKFSQRQALNRIGLNHVRAENDDDLMSCSA